VSWVRGAGLLLLGNLRRTEITVSSSRSSWAACRLTVLTRARTSIRIDATDQTPVATTLAVKNRSSKSSNADS
jgi:hypothetical protein